MSTPLTYQGSGVDQDKASQLLDSFASYLKGRRQDPNVLSGIGPYASCYQLKPLLQGYSDPVLATCCDGVGTKAMLALQWNELRGLGTDLVAMNVNDLLCVGATPLLFLDYYACGRLSDAQLITILKSIQHGCELAECTLVGGETAEMPGLYRDNEFDLAGFAVGMAEREFMLGPDRVRVGDKLIAIESSGLHSNGYSLIRKLITQENLQPDDKAPFADKSWKEIFLKPTLIYVPYLKDDFPSFHGLAHITGGGLLENLPRILPKGVEAVVSASKWNMPPLFTWIQEKTKLSTESLLSTFNCGYGMVAVCGDNVAQHLIKKLHKDGLHAELIGAIEASSADSEPRVRWVE